MSSRSSSRSWRLVMSSFSLQVWPPLRCSGIRCQLPGPGFFMMDHMHMHSMGFRAGAGLRGPQQKHQQRLRTLRVACAETLRAISVTVRKDGALLRCPRQQTPKLIVWQTDPRNHRNVSQVLGASFHERRHAGFLVGSLIAELS